MRVLLVLCMLAQVARAEIAVDDTNGEPEVWKVVGYHNGKALSLEVVTIGAADHVSRRR